MEPTMSNDQCRVVTQKGTRCMRRAQDGGLGFCWQHVPVQLEEKKRFWDGERVSGTVGEVTKAVVVQIVIEALKALVEVFGHGGGSQSEAKRILQTRYPSFDVPDLPDHYVPGARVDWVALLSIDDHAKELAARSDVAGAEVEARSVETVFDQWFDQLHPYHRERLCAAIEERTADHRR